MRPTNLELARQLERCRRFPNRPSCATHGSPGWPCTSPSVLDLAAGLKAREEKVRADERSKHLAEPGYVLVERDDLLYMYSELVKRAGSTVLPSSLGETVSRVKEKLWPTGRR